MTNWQPYPGSAAVSTPTQTTYEPYPTQAEHQVSDSATSAPSEALTGYVSYADPYAHVAPRPSVTPPQAFKLALKNWHNFSGRASRTEFWYVAIAWFLVNNAFTGVTQRVSEQAAAGAGAGAVAFGLLAAVMAIVSIAVFVPFLSLTVRRFHDSGRSGWYVLMAAIPVVGTIIAALMLAKPSDPAGGQFDDPRRRPHGPESL